MAPTVTVRTGTKPQKLSLNCPSPSSKHKKVRGWCQSEKKTRHQTCRGKTWREQWTRAGLVIAAATTTIMQHQTWSLGGLLGWFQWSCWLMLQFSLLSCTSTTALNIEIRCPLMTASAWPGFWEGSRFSLWGKILSLALLQTRNLWHSLTPSRFYLLIAVVFARFWNLSDTRCLFPVVFFINLIFWDWSWVWKLVKIGNFSCFVVSFKGRC